MFREELYPNPEFFHNNFPELEIPEIPKFPIQLAKKQIKNKIPQFSPPKKIRVNLKKRRVKPLNQFQEIKSELEFYLKKADVLIEELKVIKEWNQLILEHIYSQVKTAH